MRPRNSARDSLADVVWTTSAVTDRSAQPCLAESLLDLTVLIR